MKGIAISLFSVFSLFGGEMIAVRKSDDRGKGDHGWLKTSYTFSFSDYYDAKFMGFRTLRVINEDVVSPDKGFDTHPHKDMEILTYILEGTLAHKDTMGNHSQIKAGEFQLMTAGSGVQHSEFNPSKKDSAHLLQIWIKPSEKGLQPNYQQKDFSSLNQGLKLVVSPSGHEGSLKIHQDAYVYLGKFHKEEEIEFKLGKERHAWIQIIKGDIQLNGEKLSVGDGASLNQVTVLQIQANAQSEFLLFNLP